MALTVHTGANAGTNFYAYDGKGNVTTLVNATNGVIGARYEYGPYGELLRATGPVALENPYLFSTKFCDWETGFYYYGYRYYDPSTGRWLSLDPIGEMGGVNLYSFVFNAPLEWIDNDGLAPQNWTSYDYIKQARPDVTFPKWRDANGRYMAPPESLGSIQQTPRPAPSRGIGVPFLKSTGSKKGDTGAGAAAGVAEIGANFFLKGLNARLKHKYLTEADKSCLAQAQNKGGCGGCCVVHLYALEGIYDSQRRLEYNGAEFFEMSCGDARAEVEARMSHPDRLAVNHRRFGRSRWLYRVLYDLGRREGAPKASAVIPLDEQYYVPEYLEIHASEIQ